MSGNEFRKRFRNLIILTWTLPAVVGLSFILYIELLTREQMVSVILSPLESLFIVGSLLLAVWFYDRRTGIPVARFIDQPNPENESFALSRTRRFIAEYWVLLLLYLLVAPSTVIISAELYSGFVARPVDWFRIHLVALIVSIVVGLPLFFAIFDLLGHGLSRAVFTRPLLTIKTKIFLIAALMPLLIDTMLIQYFWTRTGYFSMETFVIWLALEALAVAGAIMFARSFSRSLKPLEYLIQPTGSFGDLDFSGLNPASLDEPGLLTLKFRGILEQLRAQGYVIELINHIHREIDQASSQGEALEIIVETCLDATGDEMCFLLMLDKNSDELVGVCHTGEKFNAEGYYRISIDEQSLAAYTFRTRSVISTEDANNDSRCKPDIVNSFDIRSAISAPLIIENSVIGILISSTRSYSRTYSVHDRGFMEGLAREAALVIQTHGLQSTLNKERERAQIALQSIGDGVITTTTGGKIYYLNPVAEKLTGTGLEDAKGQSIEHILDIYNESDRKPVSRDIVEAISSSASLKLSDNIFLRQKGSSKEFDIECTISPILDQSGSIGGAVLIIRDISEATSMARKMAYLSSHDALTGLINRAEFDDRLTEALEESFRIRSEHVLCYIDLDQFKMVNDTCGHIAGDELLKQLTSLLQSQIQPPHTLARLGGDEFGILYRDTGIAEAREEISMLLSLVRSYRFFWEGRQFEIGASIGMIAVNANSVSQTELMKSVDSACYIAKDLGRNRIHVYEEDDAAVISRSSELEWLARLRQALDHDTLVLYAQPIFDFRQHPASIAFSEVLLRIPGVDGTHTRPAEFIAAAERYNLMTKVDKWVIGKVFEIVGSHPDGRRYSINLSGQSLCDEELLDFIVLEARRHDFDCSNICFEITETAAITNLPHAMHMIDSLKTLGFRFALDDFGSGISSFGYLKTLKVDYIKIDGVFVRDIDSDPVSASIVESIHHTARALGIAAIAEYVENETIRQSLIQRGIEFGQGNGLALPEPIEAASVPN